MRLSSVSVRAIDYKKALAWQGRNCDINVERSDNAPCTIVALHAARLSLVDLSDLEAIETVNDKFS